MTDKLLDEAAYIFHKLTNVYVDIIDPAIRYNDSTDKELQIIMCYTGTLSSQDYYARLLRNIIYHDYGLKLPIKVCSVRCTREQLESIITFYKLKGVTSC